MTSELKPCPFCLRPLKRSSGKFNPMAVCETDGCWMKEKQIAVPCDDPFSVKSWNTRAVPDVPELVRYDKGDICLAIENGYDPLPSKDGEYVLHSQAAEIIAAKDVEIAVGDVAIKQNALLWKRAEAAEAELAKYEAQEPIKVLDSVIEHVKGVIEDCTQCEDKDMDHPFADNIAQLLSPLYASPAPAADLKAENERLREVVEFYANPENWDNSRFESGLSEDGGHDVLTLHMSDAHQDNGAKARAILNAEASNEK